MLSQLYIENIAVIRQATIDFSQGFHVFTGETGAGKTILISAINAVLGGRTFKEIIRTGETRATVSALFTDIPAALCEKIAALGYPPEDGQLLVQREIDLAGKGQCRLDGRPATAAMLREVCSLLIDIHGQHDNQELLSAEKHLGFLDSYGAYPQELAAYTAAYDHMCDCAARLDKLQMDESYKLQRMDILGFQLKEIGDAKLIDGEEEQLQEQQKRIRNAERITESLGAVYTLLNGDGEERRGALEILEEVSSDLDTAAKFLPEFEEYGLSIPQFYLTTVVLPEDDPNFKRIRELYTISLQKRMIHADKDIRTTKAQAEAEVTAAARAVELERQQTQTEVAKRAAERKVIEAQAEAMAKKASGLAEAEVMHAMGYNQKDVLQAEVQKAYAEGIGNMGGSGGAGGSAMSDIIGLGIGLKAAGAFGGQLGNMFGAIGDMSSGDAASQAKEVCSKCGASIPASSKFCLECGEKVEKVPDNMITCPECGQIVVKGKFCPECGHKFISACPNCGEAVSSGTKFCPQCGTKL